MKSAKFLSLIVLGLVLTIPFAGCKRKPGPITPLPGQRVTKVPEPPMAPPLNPNSEPVESAVRDEVGWKAAARDQYAGWPEDREVFKSQTVYFDFDSAVVKAGEKAKADIVAAHLKSNPSHALKVEGHCDERGTEEYNRALGDRRALAVRETLIAAGIEPGRIVTISYGEDRPAAQGHNEAAYKLNRRGEFVLLTPPK